MSLEFRATRIHRTDGTIREGRAAHSTFKSPTDRMIFRSDHDLLSRPKRVITPKDSSSLYTIDQVNRTIFVSNTELEDWAITADIIDIAGVATIDYLITEFRGRGSEAMLTPLDIIAVDPDRYLPPEIALRLLTLDSHTLGQHAIHSTLLISYLQQAYGHHNGPDPFDALLD